MQVQRRKSRIRVAPFLCTLLTLVTATGLNAIAVTTTLDENGENSSVCSLREAVTTLNEQTSFGGCVFAQDDTLVELEAGTYQLSLDLGISDKVNLLVPMTLRGRGPDQTIIERVEPQEDDLRVADRLRRLPADARAG